jgi:NAD(P)-dependent dehydrogenase (short-subunit alcohol dehydrogenase family)
MSVFRPGATALITGAASGIGFAVSTHCRAAGMTLHLLDINSANLSKAASLLSATGDNKAPLTTHTLDVSDPAAWSALKSELGDLELDFLMLNAGAGFKSERGDVWRDVGYFQKTFGANVFGMLNGLEAFLPAVKKGKGKKAISLTGSKQGITNPPLAGNPAYNSSKAAVKSIAEHLSFDLHKSYPDISVHLLIPGWTFTAFSGNSGPTSDEEAMEKKPKGAWLPSQVKDELVKAVEEGKFYVVCPDNDVTGPLDAARMEWGVREINGKLQPLSRWREDGKAGAAEWIEGRSKEIESGKL